MNEMFKFFDSCTHPTLNGEWTFGRRGQTFEDSYVNFVHSNVSSACAIGLPNVGGYSHKNFFDEAKIYGNFFYPVAAITIKNVSDLEREINEISDIGFEAVKIHPRLLGTNGDVYFLERAFDLCRKYNLTVFFCTYWHDKILTMPDSDPFFALVNALRKAPDLRVVLLHGGGVDLMRYAELVRFNHNLLLDLSLTLQKYAGSSVDLDLAFLAQKFDQRICVGSDHPEWSTDTTLKSWLKICQNNTEPKTANSLFSNLNNFLKTEER